MIHALAAIGAITLAVITVRAARQLRKDCKSKPTPFLLPWGPG